MFGTDIKKTLSKATPRQLLDELVRQNPELIVEHVAEKHRDLVIEMVIGDQRKPINFDNLEFRFIDTNGKRYYGFPVDMPLPIQRFGKMRDFMMWMSVGVSPGEFEMLLEVCDKSWIDTLKTKKNHQRVGLLLQELRLRLNMVMHTELLYNFMAVQWIREDENPERFDNTIHDEKVQQFKKDTQDGNTYFFFHQPELKKLNTLYNFTPDEWLAYWSESQQKEQFLKTALKTISYEIASQKETKTLKPD